MTTGKTAVREAADLDLPARSNAADSLDSRHYREVLGSFPSGVTVITTQGDQGPVGFTCQSFYSVSIDPPLISFSIARTSRSLDALREHQHVVVNILSSQQRSLSAQFARSGTDKFKDVSWQACQVNGAPELDGVSGWVAGTITREMAAGDHFIILVRVRGLHSDPAREPLIFHRGTYRDLEYEI